jgi:uncharacterized protein
VVARVIPTAPNVALLDVGGLTFSAPEAVAVLLAAMTAGALQSWLGFGASFVLIPVLAVVAPEVLPGAIIVAIIPLSATMIVVRRRGLDAAAVGRVTLGRLPGIVIGGALVGAMSQRGLTIAIAGTLLLAVVSMVVGWEIRVTRPREIAAGALSGVTGTAAALGGPPMALLYRGSAGERLRGTLAGVWLVGSVPTLLSLALFGSLTLDQVRFGALLTVPVVLGLIVAARGVARISDAVLRRAVLWWAGAGAVAAIVRATLAG